MTPNAHEFKRIWMSVMGGETLPENVLGASYLKEHFCSHAGIVNMDSNSLPHEKQRAPADAVRRLSVALNGATVVRKGPVDIISNGVTVAYVASPTSNRRCGGQGDIVAGSIGTFAHWAALHSSSSLPSCASSIGTVDAAAAACILARAAAASAFQVNGRSATAPDVLGALGDAFRNIYEDPEVLSMHAGLFSEWKQSVGWK